MGLFSKSKKDKGPAQPRNELLQQLLGLDEKGPFTIQPGNDTDIVVTNEVVNKSWVTGKKKVSYQARILLQENDHTAYFWEMLQESSSGLQFKVGFEKTRISGKEVFSSRSEKIYAPGGEKVLDYQFDYGSLREAFKEIIEAAGWNFKLVILKGKTERK
ncbi:MAG: hypothetical protein ACOX6L_09375 [Syntrophomonadaceae bacterium]|jgi:hypothetical protein